MELYIVKPNEEIYQIFLPEQRLAFYIHSFKAIWSEPTKNRMLKYCFNENSVFSETSMTTCWFNPSGRGYCVLDYKPSYRLVKV